MNFAASINGRNGARQSSVTRPNSGDIGYLRM
jgi:hypothetical protein